MIPDDSLPFSRFDFTGHDVLTVAVSGGSDSLALLVLAHRFVRLNAPHLTLFAVTVDHGLRQESADEAARVADICARTGIDHRIMVWRGAKPATGLAAAAREARYGLIAAAAREAGSSIILTGHTMDDQAETVAMRMQRAAPGKGIHGLAGMAPFTLFDEDVWIVRPLLNVRRSALRAVLREEKLEWIDDPTNRDRGYERVRIRQSLNAGHAQDRVEQLAGDALAVGRHRKALTEKTAELLGSHVSMPACGLWRIDRAALGGDGRNAEAVCHAMRVLLAVVGGSPFLPDKARTAALLGDLTGSHMRATLSRALVHARNDAIWLRRERRNLPDVSLASEEKQWDGRWRIWSGRQCQHLKVGPCDSAEWQSCQSLPEEVPRGLAKAAFSTEPGVWQHEAFVGHVLSPEAQAAGMKARPAPPLFCRYLSGFDLDVAKTIYSIIGAPPFPPPPWRNHNVR